MDLVICMFVGFEFNTTNQYNNNKTNISLTVMPFKFQKDQDNNFRLIGEYNYYYGLVQQLVIRIVSRAYTLHQISNITKGK